MNNQKKNNIEQLFDHTFNGYEAEFDPKAWDHMKKLLEEEDNRPAVIVPPQNQNNQSNLTTILIVMSTLGILSLCGWFMFNSGTLPFNTNTLEQPLSGISSEANKDRLQIQAGSEPEASKALGENHASEAELSDSRLNISTTPSDGPSALSTGAKLYTRSKSKSVDRTPHSLSKIQPENTDAYTTADIALTEPEKDSSVTEVRQEKNYRIVTRKVWVPETYETVESESSGFNDRGFIGVHITTENIRSQKALSGGFNLQGMSGNFLNSKYFALHGGFDWGMQFYGSGLRSNVALNTDKSDSAYSTIQNYSTDLLARLHLEFGASKLVVPYLNFMTGPRIYTSSQVIKSYRDLTEYENRTSNNLHSSVSLMYGIGAGLRFRISHTVSLDFRYEYINGSAVKRVDMNNTTFNGINYNKQLITEKPRLEQFKVGLLFNLTSREYEERISEEGYMKVVAVDSIEISEKDSNVIYVPCPCIEDCNKKVRKRSEQSQTPKEERSQPTEQESPYIYREDDSSDRERNNNNGIKSNSSRSGSGSSSGGSTKKSFPGVKPPSRPTESGGTR